MGLLNQSIFTVLVNTFHRKYGSKFSIHILDCLPDPEGVQHEHRKCVLQRPRKSNVRKTSYKLTKWTSDTGIQKSSVQIVPATDCASETEHRTRVSGGRADFCECVCERSSDQQGGLQPHSVFNCVPGVVSGVVCRRPVGSEDPLPALNGVQ